MIAYQYTSDTPKLLVILKFNNEDIDQFMVVDDDGRPCQTKQIPHFQF